MFRSRIFLRIHRFLFGRNLSEYDNGMISEKEPIAYRGISNDLCIHLYGRTSGRVQWGYGDGRTYRSRIYRDDDGREYFQAGRNTVRLDEFIYREE